MKTCGFREDQGLGFVGSPSTLKLILFAVEDTSRGATVMIIEYINVMEVIGMYLCGVIMENDILPYQTTFAI